MTKAVKLYKPGEIATICFLGGPIVPTWMISKNYKSLGKEQLSQNSLVAGLILSIAILISGLLLNEYFNLNVLIFPAIYSIILYGTLKKLQGEDIKQTKSKKNSIWEGLLLVAISFAITNALLTAFVFILVDFGLITLKS